MRSKGLLAVLLAALCVLLMPTSAAFAGRLFATGHDLDYHCAFNQQCGYVTTSVNYVRAAAPDPTRPVLVVARRGNQWITALSNAYSGSPPPTVLIDPRSLAWASTPLTTASYSAIVIASDITCGGCDLNEFASTPDSNAINARAADLATFFNDGGGLIFASGAEHGNGSAPDDVYYNAVPLPVTGLPVAPPFTLTTDGTMLGLTDADANCCLTHNSFNEPPTGSSLKVAERDARNQVETLFTEGAISGGKIYTLDLSPADATNPVGSDHTVTATLKDQNGPVGAEKVLFTVTGVNPTSGVGTTNAGGDATFSWHGTNAGDDMVVACFDVNKNGTCDRGELVARATKHWQVARSKLSVNDVTVTEGNTGYSPPTPATFTVSLDTAAAGPVDVELVTADGTATSPADYQGGLAKVHFDAGETSKQVTVNVNGDLIDEPNETFKVHLQNATGATIDRGDGVGTIVDDDRNGTFSCRASAIRVGANEGFVANAPDDPCKDATKFVVNARTTGGAVIVTASAVKATTDSTPDNPALVSPTASDNVNAHADAAGVTILSGLNVIRLSVLRADANVTCSAARTPVLSSSGEVVALTVNGRPVGDTGAPVTIPLLLATLRLNQVTTTGTRITRRALVLDSLLLPQVVMSEATADVHGNPCAA